MNPKINGVYLRDNLTDKIKDGTYVINHDEYADIDTYRIALHVLENNVTYFDTFGTQRITEEITFSMGNKNILTNIFRVQSTSI